jgi:voltage-gated potassium channel
VPALPAIGTGNTPISIWYTCVTQVGTGIAALPHISRENNFSYLAAGLVLLLFIGAVLEYLPGDTGPLIMQAGTVAIIFISAWTEKGIPSRLVANLVFVLVMVLMVAGGALLDMAGFSYMHLFILLCFFLWTTWLVAHQVLFTGTITSNDIVGAICIYMLLGLIWAILYLFIAEIVPGSFNGLPQAPWLENFAAAIYFSFVTITTLGYGDISPILPLARFLVIMEAIVGVFYMAILVASLIGVRMSIRESAKKQ